MQEQMNKAMTQLSETVGEEVPTFEEVRNKIEKRLAKAQASTELTGARRRHRRCSRSSRRRRAPRRRRASRSCAPSSGSAHPTEAPRRSPPRPRARPRKPRATAERRAAPGLHGSARRRADAPVMRRALRASAARVVLGVVAAVGRRCVALRHRARPDHSRRAAGGHDRRTGAPATTRASSPSVTPAPATRRSSQVADQMEQWAAAGAPRRRARRGRRRRVPRRVTLRSSPPTLDVPYADLRVVRGRSGSRSATTTCRAVTAREQLADLGLPDLPYAKTLPDVQLLFLDANHPDEAQAQWLDARLSEPGPALRVVVFHQPAYSCAAARHARRRSSQWWVPILEAHRVALVINGHDHYYERFTLRPNDVTTS